MNRKLLFQVKPKRPNRVSPVRQATLTSSPSVSIPAMFWSRPETWVSCAPARVTRAQAAGSLLTTQLATVTSASTVWIAPVILML